MARASISLSIRMPCIESLPRYAGNAPMPFNVSPSKDGGTATASDRSQGTLLEKSGLWWGLHQSKEPDATGAPTD